MRIAKRRKFQSLLLVAILAVAGAPSLSTAVAETAIDEQFQVVKPPGAGYTGYLVNNTRSFVRNHSFLGSFSATGKKISDVKSCTSLAECPKDFLVQVADMNLTLCENAMEENCIRGVKATNLTTKETSTKFIPRPKLTADFGAIVKGNPSVDLPNGGNPLVVSIPDAPHVGGDLYLIKSDFYAKRKSANEKFKLDLITNAIFPISIVRGKFNAGQPHFDKERYASQSASAISASQPPYVASAAQDAKCLMATKTICLKPEAFPENFSFQLSIRANQGFTSWLYGRLANPAITVTRAKVDERAVLVTIDAEPVRVPVIFGWVANSTLPANLLAKYTKSRGGTIYVGKDREGAFDSVSILKGQSNNYDEQGIDEMLSWMPLLGDKAAAMPSQWNFQTLSLRTDTAKEISKCATQTDSLSGLIFTNATVYSAGAPTFDASSGTLDYKVAAPHLKPNGDLMLGTYDLILSSTVARCLYGFSKAPIGATVSVISNDGQSQVATTIINEKDGFFRMGAYGFGFSSPTIRMKITQTSK